MLVISCDYMSKGVWLGRRGRSHLSRKDLGGTSGSALEDAPKRLAQPTDAPVYSDESLGNEIS